MKTVSESTSALLKTDLDNQRKKRDEYKEKEKTHREYFDTINAHFTAALTEVQLLHAQYNQYDDLYHNRVEGRVQEKREFIMKCP
jgi:predicted translin family RNA/ssDNA-binding protein